MSHQTLANINACIRLITKSNVIISPTYILDIDVENASHELLRAIQSNNDTDMARVSNDILLERIEDLEETIDSVKDVLGVK